MALKHLLFGAVVIGATMAGTISQTYAQGLSPMRKLITSFNDEFVVKVYPKNPYKHRIKMAVRVYDENFRLTPAHVSPQTMIVGAGGSRPVNVVVPFLGNKEKRVRICAESIPFENQPTIIRAQVCGRFLAIRGK